MGQKEMAINYRSHFAYRIDAWDADGENVIEHLAGVEDLQVAKATYLAACQRWDTNHLAPGHTSNRGQSADSACVRSAAAMTARTLYLGKPAIPGSVFGLGGSLLLSRVTSSSIFCL
jgi:hypothetical protein